MRRLFNGRNPLKLPKYSEQANRNSAELEDRVVFIPTHSEDSGLDLDVAIISEGTALKVEIYRNSEYLEHQEKKTEATGPLAIITPNKR